MKLVDLAADPNAEVPRPNAVNDVAGAVAEIIARVRDGGDDALRELTHELDDVEIDSLRISGDEIDAAADAVDDAVMNAMEAAAGNIRTVAEHQRLKPWEAEVAGGVVGEYINPVNRAGIYVPGGRASYPSTVLMTAMPARVAGVKEIVMCVPPGKDGKVPAATLAAAGLCAVDEVYRIGGAQAIAAMAYGTETIKPADVIVGPGNVYVAEAKKQVAGEVGIESVAGPSEIVIVADSSADPGMVALDLIAQAEHGPGGLLAVVCWDTGLLEKIDEAVTRALEDAGAPDAMVDAVSGAVVGIKVSGLDGAVSAVNGIGPEHLELIFDGAEREAPRFTSAGAIFVGPDSPVSIGDYFAGSNHVLPTGNAARWASGLRTSHFQKASAVIRHTKESLKSAADHIDALAKTEGLPLHSKAVKARL